jgi:hypothetical protein
MMSSNNQPPTTSATTTNSSNGGTQPPVGDNTMGNNNDGTGTSSTTEAMFHVDSADTTSTMGTATGTASKLTEQDNQPFETPPQLGNMDLIETANVLEKTVKAASSARLGRLERMENFYAQQQAELAALRKEQDAREDQIIKQEELRDKERKELLKEHGARQKERYDTAQKMIQENTKKWEAEFTEVKTKEEQDAAGVHTQVKELIRTLSVKKVSANLNSEQRVRAPSLFFSVRGH